MVVAGREATIPGVGQHRPRLICARLACKLFNGTSYVIILKPGILGIREQQAVEEGAECMNKRLLCWLIPAALYGVFFAWYTDFGGPLSDEEIDHFTTTLAERGAPAEGIAHLEGFLRNDTGRQFLMLNALDMSDNPPTIAGEAPGQTADELMARYMKHMLPELLKRACHPVILGDAVYSVLDVVGIEGAEQWTGGAFIRYRSRRSFMEIVANPAIIGPHHLKLAALEKTIAFPVETQIYLGDLRWLLGLLLLSITALLDIALFGRGTQRQSI